MKFKFISELDWRQLFDIYEDIQGALSSMGLKIYPVDFEKHLKGLIKNCRNYFSSLATDEMLAEFRPFFCPHDSIMIKAISYCSLFLPTTSVERWNICTFTSLLQNVTKWQASRLQPFQFLSQKTEF